MNDVMLVLKIDSPYGYTISKKCYKIAEIIWNQMKNSKHDFKYQMTNLRIKTDTKIINMIENFVNRYKNTNKTLKMTDIKISQKPKQAPAKQSPGKSNFILDNS